MSEATTPRQRLMEALQLPKTTPPAPGHSGPARGKRHFALGHRRKPGEMNRTEARYEAEVLKPLYMTGEVGWYAFEAIKLKLAANCFFTVDFALLAADGVLEMVDVKGAEILIEEDAAVKVKVAAALFPFRFAFVWPAKRKDGGGWVRREFSR